eukprot:GGOE01001011.1.p1 GENE.GGOE01001011.1~~GGOE01001011.1.p1  ORF type:complete len:255 (-),score=67.10 GGOE01001011.1:191-955(-)
MILFVVLLAMLGGATGTAVVCSSIGTYAVSSSGCTCWPGWVGTSCEYAPGEVGILDPPNTQNSNMLRFDISSVAAGASFILQLQGFRVPEPPAGAVSVRISAVYGQCKNATSEGTVDSGTKAASLTAPTVPGNYSLCVRLRQDFDLVYSAPGVPQTLIVVAPNATVPLSGFPSCREYLKGANKTDACGCFVLGTTTLLAKVPNDFNVGALLANATPPSLFSGCCGPYSPQRVEGNTPLGRPWGSCVITGASLSS